MHACAVVILALLGAPAGESRSGAERGHPPSATLPTARQQVPEDSGYVHVDGADLFVRVVGEGRPVLVLHGGPSIGHRYLVDGLRPLASAGYRLIFFDQRGIGRSTGSADSARLTVSRYLDDVEALRAALADEPVHLLGHSWGALLALSYAIDHPNAVRGLVLLSPTEPGHRYDEERDRNLATATTAADSAELAALLASEGYREGDPAVVEEIYRTIYRGWLGDPSAAARFVFGLNLGSALRGRAVGARVSEATAGLARWQDLERLYAETLIIHGEVDPIPLAISRDLAEEIDGVRLEVLEGVGHFPTVEAPERVTELVGEFLGSAESRASPPPPAREFPRGALATPALDPGPVGWLRHERAHASDEDRPER